MKMTRRGLLGGALAALLPRRSWAQLMPWSRRAVSPSGGGGFSPLAVVLDYQQPIWDFPAMTDNGTGILSFWVYVASQTPVNGSPDINEFPIYAGSSYTITSPQDNQIFYVASGWVGASANITNVSNASEAVITVTGVDLTTTAIANGSAIQLNAFVQSGWVLVSTVHTVISFTSDTITVDLDSSTFPAWVQADNPDAVTIIGGIANMSSANPCVATFYGPHGIDLSAGDVWVSFFPFTQSPWTELRNAKVLSGTADTLTLDFDASTFASYVPSENAPRVSVINAPEATFATVDQTKFYNYTSTTPLPPGKFVNVLMSWDMNQAAGSKKLSVYFGDTPVPGVINDATGAFEVPYSVASSNDFRWMIGGNSEQAFTSGAGYLAEYYFNAAGPYLDFSIDANRAKFHDLTTGAPVDLGSDGAGPTGSAPTLYLSLRTSDQLTPPVTGLTWWEANQGGYETSELVQSPGLLGSIADSTSMVMSFWIDRNTACVYAPIGGPFVVGNALDLMYGAGSGVLFNNFDSPFLVTVLLCDGPQGIAGTHYFIFSFPYDGGDGTNIRFSVDTNHAIGSKVVKAYVGTTEAAVTVVQDDIDNLSVKWQDGTTDFNAIMGVTGWISEVWFGPGQLFDVSSKFVDGSGNPVDLGANGQLPSGTSPAVFLHLSPGDPVTNLNTNLGTGGNFVGADNFVLTNGTRFTDNRAGTGQMRLGGGPLLIAPISP